MDRKLRSKSETALLLGGVWHLPATAAFVRFLRTYASIEPIDGNSPIRRHAIDGRVRLSWAGRYLPVVGWVPFPPSGWAKWSQLRGFCFPPKGLIVAFTYFFRDAQTLELLIEQALPTLRGQAFIRIWDAGCAHGPEPYTLAMLLRERMSDFLFRNVRIHATDVESQFGPGIAAGVYADQEVKRIPDAIRERYFRPAAKPGHVQVVEEIREKVTFAEHDLLGLKPPREDFSLIVCKNVLLHFNEAQRVQVLRMFHGALRPGGLLATEHTQKLPASLDGLFESVVCFAQIHRRLDAAEAIHTHIDGPHVPAARLPKESPSREMV